MSAETRSYKYTPFREVKTKEVNAKYYQGQLEQTSEELESLRKRVRQLEDELQRRNE